MSEELENTARMVFDSFMGGLKGYAEANVDQVKSYFADRAKEVAEQLQLMVTGTEAEKNEAQSNIKFLKARARASVYEQTFFATEEVKRVAYGILESGFSLVEKLTPAIVGKLTS